MTGSAPRPVVQPPDDEALSPDELIRLANESRERAERERIRQRERSITADYQAGFHPCAGY